MQHRDDLADALRRWLPTRRWYADKGHAIESIRVESIDLPRPSPVRLLVVHVTFDGGRVQPYAVPLLLDDLGRFGDEPVDAMSVESGASEVVEIAVRSGRDHRIRLLGVEQSNSSVIVDETMIAKLVRRLEPGLNPDVEVPRHLSRVGFAHAPGLVAHFDVDVPGGRANAIVVHDAITNEGDLWGWIGRHPDQATQIAELLGRRTAQLHTALATASGEPSPGFTPEPSSIEAQHRDLDAVRRSLVATQQALGGRPGPLAAPAGEVLRRFARLTEHVVDTSRIRIHGDLHLGQILWTGHDVVFIDFEGEPARPMAERAVKRPGLVDVAGLLRSFDYAGRNAGLDQSWVADASRVLVDAYLDTIPVALAPSDPHDVALLLDLFLLDKALYEIRYELVSRPDWLQLPLRAAEQLLS